jgi:hypothetical protein
MIQPLENLSELNQPISNNRNKTISNLKQSEIDKRVSIFCSS